jgi:trehalose 6-phosphate phosphatase
VRVDTGSLIAQLAERPGDTGLLLDVDGTLAPIVERPEDAAVPEPTRALLRRLADRYALVACISGRPEDDARRVVGVDGIEYVGEHGLALDPEAAAWQPAIDEIVESAGWPPERKPSSVAFHYRTADDEEAAVTTLRRVEERATARGLRARWGRKVLEILPPVEANKGTVVRTLVADHGLACALYAGDDATDLDAFHGLDSLDVAVRVAVVSEEGPGDLAGAADVVVAGPEALAALLQELAT